MKKILIILLSTLVVAGLLFNTGCKKKAKFDITGMWVFTITLSDESFDETYTFVGDRRSGDVYWEDQDLGTYLVTGEYIDFTLEYYYADETYVIEVYSGSFDMENQMSGNMTITIGGVASASGTWIAFR
jgi:hypothetical protein